jgi:hypothetical protein
MEADLATANSGYCFFVTTFVPGPLTVKIWHEQTLLDFKIELIDGEGTYRVCLTTPATSPADLTILVTDASGNRATAGIVSM